MVPWFFLIAFCLCARVVASANDSCGIAVVVIGGTGDLARRYVWPAIFENFALRQRVSDKCALLAFGTYRVAQNGGKLNFSSLNTRLNCPSGVGAESCDQWTRSFEENVRLFPLNSDDDFRSLAKELERSYAERNITELGRLFYLAIPPSAYPSVCRNIDAHSRPTNGWLRVVLEKPFGRDQESAEQLSQKISEQLDESEVYRIDHYLGKTGVQQIMPFRANNVKSPALPSWNARSVERVEVVMKERLDVKGRTRFFDDYGVIRDVHQNHLTEILVRLLTDVAADESFLKQKTSVLSALYSPGPGHAVLGQYAGYQQHLVEDGVASTPNNVSYTPTFASVALYSRDAHWNGVPFVLTAGKNLNERTSYAKVAFKNNFFSVANASATSSCAPEIIFMIQDEILQKPGILLSWHFNHAYLKPPFPFWDTETVQFPTNSSCVYSFMSPSVPPGSNPYGSLIGAILDGDRELFVDTQSLLQSWKVWTPLLQDTGLSSMRPLLYSPDSLRNLDFTLGPDGVHLLNSAERMHSSHLLLPNGHQLSTSSALREVTACGGVDHHNLSALFEVPTHVGSRSEITDTLAAHIYTVACDAVTKKGQFHLALPVGQSPLALYQTLVLKYRDAFPWHKTHVWLTDERCVPSNEEGSNIRSLSTHLLALLPVPYCQIHPFPTELQHGLCSPQDNGALLHEKRLNSSVEGGVLDYIVLGVGGDGHVASLFPGASHTWDRMVELVEVQGATQMRERMTLTFKALKLAKHVSLLLSGSHQEKHSTFIAFKACFESPASNCGLPAHDVLLFRHGSPTSLYIDALLL